MIRFQSPVVIASVATIATGLIAYSAYFDYRRRNVPEFRRELRRQERRVERAVKTESEAAAQREMAEIRTLAILARSEAVPIDPNERQAYIISQLDQGQRELDRSSMDPNKTALCFFKALLASPNKMSIIGAYEQQLPKSVLHVITHMVLQTPALSEELFGVSLKGELMSEMPTIGPD